MSNLPIPQWFDAQSIFAKFESGKSSDAIAKELGVKRSELVKQLKKHPENWREIRTVLQYIRLEDAIEDMDAAAAQGDTQKVKCYESVIRTCQWELERVHRQVYGETKEAPLNPVQIVIGLRRQVVISGIDDDEEKPAAEVAIPQAKPKEAEEAKIIEEQPKPEPEKKKRTVFVPPSPAPKLNYDDTGIV